jgi:hypothetical protein
MSRKIDAMRWHRLNESEKIWDKLVAALTANEWAYSSRVMRNHKAREVWFPEPWIKAMTADPVLAKTAAMLKSLPVTKLAPMSDELRELAMRLGLPIYLGTADPNPPPNLGNMMATEDARLAQEEAEAAPAQLARQRCPRCGNWLKPLSYRRWEQTFAHNPALAQLPTAARLADQSPPACYQCGYIEGGVA